MIIYILMRCRYKGVSAQPRRLNHHNNKDETAGSPVPERSLLAPLSGMYVDSWR